MTIRRVEIVRHTGKARVNELADELTRYLQAKGLEVGDEKPDLVVALGGDGTVLRAAQRAHAVDALLIGINLGALGYLTEVEAGGEQGAIDRILGEEHRVEERMMLSARVVGRPDEYVGLNEVLVERATRHRLVQLDVRAGGELLGNLRADGVIVATPTGSTAYAISAGGPVVSPRASCLVVVPVSAHIAMARPFVLAPDELVEIEVESDEGASLSLDGGMGCDLSGGDRVEVGRHERPLRLVRLGGPGFLERFRKKLYPPSS